MASTQILAPVPGTFYRKPSPSEPPFKSERDEVAVGDTIGLIEVMKTFTPVESEVSGTLVKFIVENEEAVMAGQPLCEVE